jgi:hypothetical protein
MTEKVILEWDMEGLRYGGEAQAGVFRLVTAKTQNGWAYAFQERIGADKWQVIAETSRGVLGMPAWMAAFCAQVHEIFEPDEEESSWEKAISTENEEKKEFDA